MFVLTLQKISAKETLLAMEMFRVEITKQHHVINALVTPLVLIKDNSGAMVIVIGRMINAKVIISISEWLRSDHKAYRNQILQGPLIYSVVC